MEKIRKEHSKTVSQNGVSDPESPPPRRKTVGRHHGQKQRDRERLQGIFAAKRPRPDHAGRLRPKRPALPAMARARPFKCCHQGRFAVLGTLAGKTGAGKPQPQEPPDCFKPLLCVLGCPAVTAFIGLNAPKKHRLPHIFTPEELGHLYDDYYNGFVKKANAPTHWRNYVMLGFLVYQGLTTSELDGLDLQDADLQKASLRVQPKGRRGSPRTLPLQACQIGGLMHYTATVRPRFTQDESEPKLFLPLPEAALTGDKGNTSIRSALRYLHRHLKTLHKDYHKMTQLRASAITHWIKSQGLRKAQYLAGHKSIVSTEEYLANDLEALTDDLSKYHPF